MQLAGGEYLVNIVEGRRTAQERVTGGRWRRIVLGDVLAGGGGEAPSSDEEGAATA
jgi:hypothetical protein